MSDFEHASRGLLWKPRYVGDWDHPRAQKMMAFERMSTAVGTRLPWYHPAAVWYAISRSAGRLPTEEQKRHLTGVVLHDSQSSESV